MNIELQASIKYNIKMLLRTPFKRGPLFHNQLQTLLKYRELDVQARQFQQMDYLNQIINYAEKTSYYKELLLDSKQFNNPIDRLKTIPLLEKETLRTSYKKFCRNIFPTFSSYTSGTTGTPLILKRNLFGVAREEAGFFSWFCSAGWKPNLEMIVLRGDLVTPAWKTEPPFGIYDIIGNRIVLSSFHLADRTIPWYLNIFKKTNAKFLNAYPSSAYILADFIRRNKDIANIAPLKLKAVFLASESVYDYQKEIINEFLGPVHSHYGSAERCTWMTTCSAGCYHEDTSYGYVEYMPLYDNMYEIVATGFTNNNMPLLRYRTGDIAIEPFGWHDNCECGRPGPGCKTIIGRIDDLFITETGHKIGRLDHIFKNVQNIIAAQIIQHSLTDVEFIIVKATGYTNDIEQQLLSNFYKYVPNAPIPRFSYVSNIPANFNGKFRAVISYVKQP